MIKIKSQYLTSTESPKDHLNMIIYDQMSIQKTSPLPSLKQPYTTITNKTSNLFKLDSPSDTIPVPTHNIGPNPLPKSNLNPPRNNINQQFINNPSTSQLFTINPSSNPLTSQSSAYHVHDINSFILFIIHIIQLS